MLARSTAAHPAPVGIPAPGPGKRPFSAQRTSILFLPGVAKPLRLGECPGHVWRRCQSLPKGNPRRCLSATGGKKLNSCERGPGRMIPSEPKKSAKRMAARKQMAVTRGGQMRLPATKKLLSGPGLGGSGPWRLPTFYLYGTHNHMDAYLENPTMKHSEMQPWMCFINAWW